MTFTAADRPAIFYAPHADDETLSLGVSIANHLAAGRNVLVVLMTAGCSQWVEDMLNGRVGCSGMHIGAHDLTKERYADVDLPADVIGQARQDEFASACGAFAHGALGRVQIEFQGIPDGTLTVAKAKQIIASYALRFPTASHKTMTWTDPAADHAACGQALRELRTEGALTDARFYVMPERQSAATAGGVAPWREDLAANVAPRVLARAASAYKAWNPAAGSYAVGYHSVPEAFDRLAATPFGLVHA